MDIQSNSQQESYLTSLKNKIRCVCNEHDADKLISDIQENAKLHKIDVNKYAKAVLNEIDGKDIKSPYPYIKKVAWSVANERWQEFVKDYLPNYTELHLELDKIGMTGQEWEKYFIDEIITHCLQNFPINIEDMLETMWAIVDYCKSRNALTYRDYIRYLMASRIVKKCNVPLNELEIKAKTEFEKFTKECEILYAK